MDIGNENDKVYAIKDKMGNLLFLLLDLAKDS